MILLSLYRGSPKASSAEEAMGADGELGLARCLWQFPLTICSRPAVDLFFLVLDPTFLGQGAIRMSTVARDGKVDAQMQEYVAMLGVRIVRPGYGVLLESLAKGTKVHVSEVLPPPC